MDIDNFLTSVNDYGRDYILYLIKFFGIAHDGEPAEHIADEGGQIVLHALISLTAGVFLQQMVISHAVPQNDAVLGLFVRELMFWLFFAFVIHLLTRNAGTHSDFASSLSAVLRVFPPAFLFAAAIGSYAAAITPAFLNSAHLKDADNYRGWAGVIADSAAEWLFVPFAIHFALAKTTKQGAAIVPPEKHARRFFVAFAILAILIVAHLLFIGPLKFIQGLCFLLCSH
jgi:hypothetical protein